MRIAIETLFGFNMKIMLFNTAILDAESIEATSELVSRCKSSVILSENKVTSKKALTKSELTDKAREEERADKENVEDKFQQSYIGRKEINIKQIFLNKL